ncbi:hypothetical protein CDAR_536841 [Caerostris darwini]|uniref:Uncharacterized protein n=1 Tax=Caerostris darwini TaxID=1538125 RepID=A0AAV4VFP6_9ARAC|nr:hypothetical protein CDAR_536841 [Caerostris darwini]
MFISFHKNVYFVPNNDSLPNYNNNTTEISIKIHLFKSGSNSGMIALKRLVSTYEEGKDLFLSEWISKPGRLNYSVRNPTQGVINEPGVTPARKQ